MLGVVLTLCLVIIAIACLVPNNWDCLVCLEEIMCYFADKFAWCLERSSKFLLEVQEELALILT